MKSILALCAQDFKRLMTNALFWVLTVTLVIIIFVVNFALPGEVASPSHSFVTYNTVNFEHIGKAMESEEALREAVRGGAVIGLVGGADGITVVHPNLSEKTLNAAILALNGSVPIDVTIARINERSEPIPFNKRLTPIFICFEALITGFILGGTLMLAEKEDKTIKALRIAPMGAFPYLISKTLLFSLIGILYATLMCVFCVGLHIAWMPFLLLAFFGTAIFTLIGLAYTTLFKDMSGWFFSMTLLLTINMLPAISYSSPSFAPFWMKLIPSYPILFSFEKALFGGRINTIYVIVTVAAWCVAAYLIAHLMTSKLLLKGARS